LLSVHIGRGATTTVTINKTSQLLAIFTPKPPHKRPQVRSAGLRATSSYFYFLLNLKYTEFNSLSRLPYVIEQNNLTFSSVPILISWTSRRSFVERVVIMYGGMYLPHFFLPQHTIFQKIFCCGKFVTTHYFLSHSTLFFSKDIVLCAMSATRDETRVSRLHHRKVHIPSPKFKNMVKFAISRRFCDMQGRGGRW